MHDILKCEDELEIVVKVRIKFSKHGVLKYIGHLDLMRYFQKAFRRTDINVCFSTGFSPHMIMSFASPLGVGIESDGEYFDVELEDCEDITTIKARLNEQMAEGIKIEHVTLLDAKAGNAMASVAACEYEMRFVDESPIDDSVILRFNELSELNFTKKTKKSEALINIKDLVFEISYSDNVLHFISDGSSSNNLKPIYLFEALCSLNNADSTGYKYYIVRKEIYQRNESGALVPLYENI